MSEKSTTSTVGFFKYFEKIVGYRIYIYIILNFIVGILDGIGLAMFVPLLSIATGSASAKSMGKLSFVLDFFSFLGLKLNLVSALLFIIVIFILKGCFYYIKIILFTKIRLHALKTIRFRMVEGLRDISYNGFTKTDAGKIHNNMVGETGRLITAMIQYFNCIQNVILLSTYVILALMSNWQFAVLVAIGGILSNFVYKYINTITKRYAKEISNLGHDFNGNLIQAVNHFKYLKATNFFGKYVDKLKNNISQAESITYQLGKISAISESIREPMIITVIAVVIVIEVSVIGASFESILVSLLLLYRALAYLVNMQSSWTSFVGSSAGLESVESILKDFKDKKEPYFEKAIHDITTINLSDVNLSFGQKKVLNHINLVIEKNTSVAFVGESGAGKTTLANVICGLQKPDSGNVIVDGLNLYETDLHPFRNRIGYITQEPVIFNDSIFNNITFWGEKNEQNLQKFWKVIEQVSLTQFVQNLASKENTPLGNNGILISGGQKQRISIARELYKNIELLIMDEATSALDSETELFIKSNIDELNGQLTIVIIAHRLSTIKNVNKIYLMDQGNIVSQGNFEDLYNTSDRFRKMVDLQGLT